METSTAQQESTQESTIKTEPRKEHQWLQKLAGEWTFEGETTILLATTTGC